MRHGFILPRVLSRLVSGFPGAPPLSTPAWGAAPCTPGMGRALYNPPSGCAGNPGQEPVT